MLNFSFIRKDPVCIMDHSARTGNGAHAAGDTPFPANHSTVFLHMYCIRRAAAFADSAADTACLTLPSRFFARIFINAEHLNVIPDRFQCNELPRTCLHTKPASDTERPVHRCRAVHAADRISSAGVITVPAAGTSIPARLRSGRPGTVNYCDSFCSSHIIPPLSCVEERLWRSCRATLGDRRSPSAERGCASSRARCVRNAVRARTSRARCRISCARNARVPCFLQTRCARDCRRCWSPVATVQQRPSRRRDL